MVDTADLKSVGESREGSTPSTPTKYHGSEFDMEKPRTQIAHIHYIRSAVSAVSAASLIMAALDEPVRKLFPTIRV